MYGSRLNIRHRIKFQIPIKNDTESQTDVNMFRRQFKKIILPLHLDKVQKETENLKVKAEIRHYGSEMKKRALSQIIKYDVKGNPVAE